MNFSLSDDDADSDGVGLLDADDVVTPQMLDCCGVVVVVVVVVVIVVVVVVEGGGGGGGAGAAGRHAAATTATTDAAANTRIPRRARAPRRPLRIPCSPIAFNRAVNTERIARSTLCGRSSTHLTVVSSAPTEEIVSES
jgi:hypothetical protein